MSDCTDYLDILDILKIIQKKHTGLPCKRLYHHFNKNYLINSLVLSANHQR